jgi:hypothetical protein
VLEKKKARLLAVGVALALLVVAMEILALQVGSVELPLPGSDPAIAENPRPPSS